MREARTYVTVGEGKSSTVYEYVQPFFRKRVYQRETLSCRCGHIVTAPAPDRVGDKTRYGASFIAHLVVSKCAHSIPQYRLEKEYRNLGIPMSRSTMCSLLHRAAERAPPALRRGPRARPTVADAPDVHADETSMRQQATAPRSAFIWAFRHPRTRRVRATHPSRSGEHSAQQVLAAPPPGRLVVDQHTGYNAVTKPGKRLRAGCLAHARRKIFEQREHTETKEALDLITEIYRVEADAKKRGIVGTPIHLALRRERSRPLFARLLRWGRRHRAAFEPRSGMGRAIRYLLRHFRELGCFLRYSTIPPDNNIAEASLRRVALGRNNFLFVGNEDAGDNIAGLYTLVATCEKHRRSTRSCISPTSSPVSTPTPRRRRRRPARPSVEATCRRAVTGPHDRPRRRVNACSWRPYLDGYAEVADVIVVSHQFPIRAVTAVVGRPPSLFRRNAPFLFFVGACDLASVTTLTFDGVAVPTRAYWENPEARRSVGR